MAQWTDRVEDVLGGSAEFEPVWDGLSAAIDAAPADAGLLRLRLRLAEVAGLRREHLDDLRRLVDLSPDDRDTRLAWATQQHGLAWLVVDDDDLDEEAQQALSDRLQAEALGMLLSLAEAHVADGDFMATLLGPDRDRMLADQSWTRLRLLLRAMAASPANLALERLLAMTWGSLAGEAPGGLPEGSLPMGCCNDAFGNLWEPLLIERALDALGPLLQRDPGEASLRELRAGLLSACGRFPEAAADHAAAADAWRNAAAAATDEDVRADAEYRAQVASDAARLHAAGPQAVVDASLSGIEEAIDRLGSGRARPETLTEGSHAFLDELDRNMLRTRDELAGDFAAVRPQVENHPWSQPDAVTRAALDDAAEGVARSAHGLVNFSPVRVLALDAAAIEAPLDDWLLATGAGLGALGWRWLAWCEYPAFRAMFGRQVVGGLWVDEAGTSLAAVTSAGAVRVIDAESELQGGAQLITTASRGRSNFGGVPGVDQLAVELQMPMADLLALHQARLALRVAQRPHDPARVIADVAAFEAMQERQRLMKLAFRLDVGVSEYEALGIPVSHPGYFVPVVRAAIWRALQRLAQAQGVRTA